MSSIGKPLSLETCAKLGYGGFGKVFPMNTSSLLQPAVQALCSRFQSNEAGVAAAIDLAVLVAAADGRIDREEMAALSISLQTTTQANLAPSFVRYLISESRKQIQTTGAAERARTIGETFAAQHCVDEGLRLGLLIALASDGLSDVEREHLERVAKAAGTSPDHVDALCQELQASAIA